MSDNIGKVGWIDITVDDADGLRNQRSQRSDRCALPSLML